MNRLALHFDDAPPEAPAPPAMYLTTLQDVAQFLRESRADVFEDWPKPTLMEYLEFHREQRAIGLAVDGARVVGVGIAWRGQRDGLEDPWHTWDDSGDCLYFAQFHAESPAEVCTLLVTLERRVPDWRQLNLFGQRNGRVVRLRPGRIDKLFHSSRLALMRASRHGH